MSLNVTILLALAFATFLCNGLQWYTQVSTYPLFARLSTTDFVPYHKAYESRLPLSIYAPYGMLMASTLAFVFVRPEGVDLGWALALLALNAAIAVESLVLAAPVHARLDREGYNEADLRRLVLYNGVRLVTATASSAVVLVLLAGLLSAR